MEAILKMMGINPDDLKKQVDNARAEFNGVVAGIHIKLDKITETLARIEGQNQLNKGE